VDDQPIRYDARETIFLIVWVALGLVLSGAMTVRKYLLAA
jgi:hypothetical protein